MLRTKIPKFHKKRRDQLMQRHPNATFIFPGAKETIRNVDVHFEFRQESNFYYLTGFEEPDAYLVLAPEGGGSYKSTIFVRERDPKMELWTGEIYGPDRAKNLFEIDEAFTIHHFEKKLSEFLDRSTEVYYRMGVEEERDRTILKALEDSRARTGRSGKGLTPVWDPSEVMGELRVIKSPEEADLMRKAAKISAAAHISAMKKTRAGMNESEIQALLEYEFKLGGCQRIAYGSIVAGGANATCLHYIANNEPLQDGDVLLIDAGGEYEYYAADITRTFPVGKAFSEEQAKVYDLVLKSQVEAVAMCRPGVSQADIHDHVLNVFETELKALGLVENQEDLKRLFPHGTGHWLGMDVHDVGLYSLDKSKKKNRPLEEGMVFTVEPGLYFQTDDPKAPDNLKGIGIRIEDDILITANGHEVLTSDVPKERKEIESLRASSG